MEQSVSEKIRHFEQDMRSGEAVVKRGRKDSIPFFGETT